MNKISIVVPCYFNEGNIPVTTSALIRNERLFDSNVFFEYVFVDDGSEDGTLANLLEFEKQYRKRVTIIKLAYNVGSYNAIYAGLKHAEGDCIVVMAADLQDPPELILKMYEEWTKGVKVVFANRETDSNIFAGVFNLLLKTVALPNLPEGGSDFCLFDKEAKEGLLAKMEPDINSLYLLLTLGYQHSTITYQKRIRKIGTSKWTTKKKFKLAWATLRWFSSERFPIVAYFWRTEQTEPPAPFVIDEVF